MNPNTESQNENDMIEMYDDRGNRILMPRLDYINTILSKDLKRYRADPDNLASTIINSFQDNAHAYVEEAAKHLMTIDTMPERAVCIYGIILLNLEKYLKAEELFLNYLVDHPRSPYVLTNLAKAQDFLGKTENTLSTLAESLDLDPNQEDALCWWMNIKIDEFEHEGFANEEAQFKTLKLADECFGGWRIKLYFGSYYAEQKNNDKACENYKEVLKITTESEVLTLISAALGNNGLDKEMVELIAPLYHPDKHHIFTGLNLLEAYFQLKQIPEGLKLLQALNKIDRADFKDELSLFQIKFDKLSKSVKPSLNQEIEIHWQELNYPLWCYGWNIKHGFDTSQTGKKIALFQFCRSSKDQQELDRPDTFESKQEQLCLAFPLYMHENIFYGSNASSLFKYPVNKKNGDLVLGMNPPSVKEISALAKQGYDSVITGVVTSNKLVISYRDLLKEHQIDSVFEFDLNDTTELLPKIQSFIFKEAGIDFDPTFKKETRGFKSILIENTNDYLSQLTQHLKLYHSVKFNNEVSAYNVLRQGLKCAKLTNSIRDQLNMISVIHLSIGNKAHEINDDTDEILNWLKDFSQKAHSLQDIFKKTTNAFQKYSESV